MYIVHVSGLILCPYMYMYMYIPIKAAEAGSVYI